MHGIHLAVAIGSLVLGTAGPAGASGLMLSSEAFTQSGPIPARYTCDGSDISPPLAWSGIPGGTQSLVLIVADPDAPDPAAPRQTWYHWVLYNIPPQLSGLPENADPQRISAAIHNGLNSWEHTGYGGPCPPVGRHRYFFHLYALDQMPYVQGQPTAEALHEAMKGHIIDEAKLMGTYEKSR
ncbi:MAG TPA: YbhB/YbcL family Raf kinase inhibitor-like protein [Nitrococcus sp.]|nr:YbhB/YbcL family Raf kinase inhibitor-like protein [Nitrococcus sp.]